MSNEEKANEITGCACQKLYTGTGICNTGKFQGKNFCIIKVAALKAMEWKDEQLRLTPDDIDTIFKLVLKERARWTDQKSCYPEVIKQFYESKNL